MNPTVEVMKPAFTSGDGYFYQDKKHPSVHVVVYFDADKPVPHPYQRDFKPGRLYLVKTCERSLKKKTVTWVKKQVKDGLLHCLPYSLLRESK